MLGPEAAAQRGGRRCRGRAGPRGQHGPLRLLAAGRGGTLPPAGVVPAPEQRLRDGGPPFSARSAAAVAGWGRGRGDGGSPAAPRRPRPRGRRGGGGVPRREAAERGGRGRARTGSPGGYEMAAPPGGAFRRPRPPNAPRRAHKMEDAALRRGGARRPPAGRGAALT